MARANMEMMMFIFTIERTDPIGYDECAGFVIVAETEKEVRKIAATNCGDECAYPWYYCANVTRLGVADSPLAYLGIVMRDFRAG